MMNITNMLNAPGDKPKRQSSTPYAKPQSLPVLETSQRSASDAECTRRPTSTTTQYAVPPHPSQSSASRYHSGTIAMLERPSQRSPTTAQSSWHEQTSVTSSYTTPSVVGGQTFPFGQYPLSRPSLSRTPSSAHSPVLQPYVGSPVSTRSCSQQNLFNAPQPVSQPGTPYRPPLTIPRTTSHGIRESTGLHDHHQRTSSGASMTSSMPGVMPSPNGMGHLLNSPNGMGHLMNSPVPLTALHQSPNVHKKPSIPRQLNMAVQNIRERSVSVEVSPRTVTSSLPRRDTGSYDLSTLLDGVSPLQHRNNSMSVLQPPRATSLGVDGEMISPRKGESAACTKSLSKYAFRHVITLR